MDQPSGMPVRPGSPAPAPPPALPQVRLARDYTHQQVAARVRDGTWRRVGRGAYLPATRTANARRVALAGIVGAHHQLAGPHVFSHESAALLWGLPLWSLPPAVHVYQRNRPGAGRDVRIRRHLGTLVDDDVTVVVGLPATALELTAVDCGRSMHPLAALVVIDGALRAGGSREAMLALLDRNPAGRGASRARQVVELGDAGAESPQESALRFALLRAGLPSPRTQVRVDTRLGTFWADLGWEEWHVVLEYDGRPKYTDAEALVREKRRHDAIVEAGWTVLRITREDMRVPDLLVARVLRLLPAGVPRVARPHLRTR